MEGSKFYDDDQQEEKKPVSLPKKKKRIKNKEQSRSTFYSISPSVNDQLSKGKVKSIFYNDLNINKEEHYEIDDFNLTQPVTVLWAESENVINSGLLDRMSAHDIALHESKYEIITSELRYLNSLNVMTTVFHDSIELSLCCNKDDWVIIFGNIQKVKKASEHLLNELLFIWEKDIMLMGIYSVLRRHAASNLRVYVEYCTNLPEALFMLRFSMQNSEQFTRRLKKLEKECGENVMSILLKPMQRITRIPLLMEAILGRLDNTTAEYQCCRFTKSAFVELVRECNNENKGEKAKENVKRSISMKV